MGLGAGRWGLSAAMMIRGSAPNVMVVMSSLIVVVGLVLAAGEPGKCATVK